MKWVAKRNGGSKYFSKPYFRGLGLLNEKKRKRGSYFWRRVSRHVEVEVTVFTDKNVLWTTGNMRLVFRK